MVKRPSVRILPRRIIPKHVESIQGVSQVENAYFTGCFWYGVGSTEEYEKLNHNLVDKLFEAEYEPVKAKLR